MNYQKIFFSAPPLKDCPQCPTLARPPPSRQACLSCGPGSTKQSWDRWTLIGFRWQIFHLNLDSRTWSGWAVEEGGRVSVTWKQRMWGNEKLGGRNQYTGRRACRGHWIQWNKLLTNWSIQCAWVRKQRKTGMRNQLTEWVIQSNQLLTTLLNLLAVENNC